MVEVDRLKQSIGHEANENHLLIRELSTVLKLSNEVNYSLFV